MPASSQPARARHGYHEQERDFLERMRLLAPVPWVTITLILLNTAVWAATIALGASAYQPSSAFLLTWGGNAASEVQHGQWWRLLSAIFLHGGVKHLAMNMLGLAYAGTAVERIYGKRQYLLLYLACGMAGSALSLHFSAQQAVSVGASGAVFGVAAAYLVSIMQHGKLLPKAYTRHALWSLGFFIVYSLLQGLLDTGIDNAAHIGGLAAGSLLALVLPARFDMTRFNRVPKSRALLALALSLLLVAGVTASAPHATLEQARMLAGQAAFAQAIAEYEDTVAALSQEYRARHDDQLSQEKIDQRARTVYVPRLQTVHAALVSSWLVPGDPRQPLLDDTRRMTELLIEALEMPSVPGRAGQKWLPAEPRRAARIDAEMRLLGKRIRQRADALAIQPVQAQ
ncbi:MAG: rhomboid family intramembrane serine protease [Janthinobacterium lividum]